jgi:DNA-binding transcriptional MerR regulator
MNAEPTYRINVAAEMSGVSENLIRAWERRYGVPKPIRTAAGYRAYARSEIEILKRLKQLTQQGVSIAEAVLLVPTLTREVKSVLAREDQTQPPQVVEYGAWRDELLRAAQRFDQTAIDVALDDAMNGRPPLAFFDELVAPLLQEVGARWHSGALSVAEEHLISNAVRQRLATLLTNAPKRARRHVVCACAPSEDHDLGLLGAALRFRHAGWKVTYLGARTPFDQLARAVTALRPDVVAVSSVRDGRELKGLRKAIPEGRIVVGGGGVKGRIPGVDTISSAEDWARLFEEFP